MNSIAGNHIPREVPLVDNLPGTRDDVFANVSVIDSAQADYEEDDDDDRTPFIPSNNFPEHSFVDVEHGSSSA